MNIIEILKVLGRAGSAIAVAVIKTLTADKDKDLKKKEGIKFKKEEKKKGRWDKFKRGVKKVFDFIISPSTLRVLTLGCIGLLALSPFGAVAAGVSAAISVGCLVSSVIMDGKNLRDLKTQQKEALAVEKLMELEKEKLTILAKSPKLVEALKKDLDEKPQMEGQDKIVKIKNVLQYSPELLVPLIGNIMSGNLVAIGIGLFSLTTSVTADTIEQHSFSKQRNELMEIVKNNKELLGIKFPAGKGIEFLKERIRESDAELKALQQLEVKVDGKGQKEIQEEFQKYKAEEMAKNKNQEYKELNVRGVGYYTGTAFFKSFSSDKNMELFAPLANYNEAKQTQLKIDIDEANEKIAKNAKQPILDKIEEKAVTRDRSNTIAGQHVQKYLHENDDKITKDRSQSFSSKYVKQDKSQSIQQMRGG